VRKISPPTPGFDLRTSQPVASRYTDCAVLALNVSLDSFITPRVLVARFFQIYSEFKVFIDSELSEMVYETFCKYHISAFINDLSHISINTEMFYYTRVRNKIARTRNLA